MKVFNDSIHGHIELHPLLVKMINTPHFQRLRYIKQLGGGYFVFPGAAHNRFEHSIGVAHLAGRLVKNLHDSLKAAVPEEERQKDELCVQIAGLCHDLGHGPFSHVFEMFVKEKKPTWKHEAASITVFEDLISQKFDGKPSIEEEMRNEYKFEDKDFHFIEELIYGPKPPTKKFKDCTQGRTEDKSYLYEIVANQENGIDVDKMDYFARDCHHLGMKSNFSHERFLVFARVCTDEEQKKHICIRDKEALNIYELFHVRFLLHSYAYQHRVKKAVEQMIVDALSEADSHLNISAADDNLEKYLLPTDNILQEILQSKDKELSSAQKIIKRIHDRDFYQFIGGRTFEPENVQHLDNAKICEKTLVAWLGKKSIPSTQAKEFNVLPVKLNYGKGKKNPVDSVWFYRKDNPGEAIQLTKNEVSYLLPEKFSETKVLVLYKGKSLGLENLAKKEIDEFWKEVEKNKNEEEQEEASPAKKSKFK